MLDADLRDFFTSLDHGWLEKFLEHRIADRRVLRLIRKWVKAGVIEDGKWSATEVGSPQGASASPLLANVYLHYVFDLWARQWRRTRARGDVVIVRFADDFVAGFEHQGDAKQFLHDLRQRFAKFNLELHPDKTRLIEFGRHAAERRAARGVGSRKRSTSSASHTSVPKRGPGGSSSNASRSPSACGPSLPRSRTISSSVGMTPSPTRADGSVPWCEDTSPTTPCPATARRSEPSGPRWPRWCKALRRRSQRHRLDWQRMNRLTLRWLPPARILHPYPEVRFAATTQGRSPVR